MKVYLLIRLIDGEGYDLPYAVYFSKERAEQKRKEMEAMNYHDETWKVIESMLL